VTKDLSIYIHWPFCKTKCPYCDFNSHENDSIEHDLWQDAYLSEIELYSEIIANRKIKTIFFGGGTPSLMKPKTIDAILNKFASKAKFSDNVEITLEANPNSIEREKFRSFKDAGINRVSIGVQSFENKNLKFLGRSHSNQDAIKAIEIARDVFTNYSFDLMYALPNQTLEEWENELRLALQYVSCHISCYQLTIEKGTQFFNSHKQRQFFMLDEETSAKIYESTHDILQANGIEQYEISNYAKPGLECQHNIVYWKLRDYIGIGPGAHGRYVCNDKIFSTINFYNPTKWRENLKDNQSPMQSKKELNTDENEVEKLVMGLRLSEGIEMKWVPNKKTAQALITDGFLELNNGLLATTLKGRLVLNAILEKLLSTS
jgi:putative oxygen-independent coproporphyrinogen III oxidase